VKKRMLWLTVVVVILLTLALGIGYTLAQEPEPQDVELEPRAWLPAVGKTKSNQNAWAELRTDRYVVGPTVPIAVEVRLHNVTDPISSWDAKLTYPYTVIVESIEYKAGLWAWLFRVDEEPILGTGSLILGQHGPWGARAEDALVAVVTLRDTYVWEPELTKLCIEAWAHEDAIGEFSCTPYLSMPCAYDWNYDGERDIDDMMLLSLHFGAVRDEAGWLYVAEMDVNGDGRIDSLDWDLAYEYWHVPCPS